MGKKIAIDFGLKRSGLAITDSSNIIASPLETVDTSILMSYLKTLFQREEVDTIVLGEPKRLNNLDTHISENVRLFHSALEKEFKHMRIVLIDERFTSKIASQTIHSMGLKKSKKQDKGLVDQISATVLLQSFLYSY
jgi:putative Holliday junction resolvase